VEYQFERLQRERLFGTFGTGILAVDTHRLPFGLRFFHPAGFSAQITATFINQDGEFASPGLPAAVPGSDRFWLVDAALRYRLPKRRGFITVGVNNLFDEAFLFQETDPATPTVQRDRLVFGRITLGF
jgi:hypothetical protein